MKGLYDVPKGQFGKNDTNGRFNFNPMTQLQERSWIKYADGVYEPVRKDGSLGRKKDDYREFQWWQENKPAVWKPQDDGAVFSWNHTLGSEDDFADQKTGQPYKAKAGKQDKGKAEVEPFKLDLAPQDGQPFKSTSLLGMGAAAVDEEGRLKASEGNVPESAPAKSSTQHAREMEKKAAKGNASGKLAGADNDAHHSKMAGADKTPERRDWTPEERVNYVRNYVGSKAYSTEGKKDDFEEGSYKCNKFVSDMLEKTGAKAPQIGGLMGGNPPLAKQWFDKELEIEDYEIVDDPRPGDVAASKTHVGVVSGPGKTISASSNTNKVVENDWGFRKGQVGNIVFRRYVGKRK